MGYVSFRESILLKGEKNRVFFFHIDVFLLDWRTFLCVGIVLLKDYIRLTVLAISWIAIQVVKLNARPPKRKPPNTEGRSLLGGRKEHSFLQLHGLPGQVAEINVRKPKDRNPFFLVMRNESNYEKIIHPKCSVFTSKNHLYTVYIYIYVQIYIFLLYILYIYPQFFFCFFFTPSTSYLLLPCLPKALPPSWALPAWHIWPRPGSSQKTRQRIQWSEMIHRLTPRNGRKYMAFTGVK